MSLFAGLARISRVSLPLIRSLCLAVCRVLSPRTVEWSRPRLDLQDGILQRSSVDCDFRLGRIHTFCK